MKTHKIYECTECSAIFKSSKDKKNHLESEHPRTKEETQQRDIGELGTYIRAGAPLEQVPWVPGNPSILGKEKQNTKL